MDAKDKRVEKSSEKFGSTLLAHIEQLAQQKAQADGFIGEKMELTLPLTVCFESIGKDGARPKPCCICYRNPNNVVICHGKCC